MTTVGVLAVGLAGCGSSSSVGAKHVPPLFSLGTGPCPIAQVGLSTMATVTVGGGSPPFRVTWILDGHADQVDHATAEPFPGGERFSLELTPSSPDETLEVTVEDGSGSGQEGQVTIFGLGSRCAISPGPPGRGT